MKKIKLLKFILVSLRFRANSLILFLFFFISFSLYFENVHGQISETYKVEGIVRDIEGAPLAGITILEKGTQNGATTNESGQFVINVFNKNGTLEVSSVGFKPLVVSIKGESEIKITIERKQEDLDEVVVIGYGTQKKEEITSSITNLTPKDFNQGQIIDPIGLIQGKVAGLNIVNPMGGDPNGTLEVQLRGLSTLAAGASPLIVIDGVPGGNLNSLNVNEIQSIDILKDGSAAAIYGTRGTNGVIIITTKRPKVGEHNIDISNQISTETVAKKLRNLDAEEFRTLLKDIYPGRESEFDHGYNTDWFKEITRTPINSSHNLSINGGSREFSYRASLNYRRSQGIVQNNSNDRVQAKFFVTQRELKDRLKIDYKLTYAGTQGKLADEWALQQAFRYNPTEPVYDASNHEAGGYYRNAGPFDYYNPVAMIKERKWDTFEGVTTGSINVSYKLSDLITLGSLASIIKRNYESDSYKGRYYPIGLGANGIADKYSEVSTDKLLQFTVDLDKRIGEHNISATLGYSYQEQGNRNTQVGNQDFDTDDFGYNNLGAGYGVNEGLGNMSSYREDNRLISFFGRINYNFRQRYLLSMSTRYEGSSRFGSNHYWGVFPAISVGWKIDNEDFFNVSWINSLKVRGGFGITGNQDIGDYLAKEILQVGPKFYYNGRWNNTFTPGRNPNPDLKWEQKAELDLGADFSILENRINGSFDYYSRNTRDLLWTYDVPVPPFVFNELFTNVGRLRNKGFEIMLNFNIVRTKKIEYDAQLNYSMNKNKLISFSDPSRGFELTDLKEGWLESDLQTWTHLIVEGGPIGDFATFKFEGIDENGQPILLDKNKDGVINDDDRIIAGNAFPKFQIGFNNSFRIGNFDVSIFLRGVGGNKIFNMHRTYYENFGYFGGKNILFSATKNLDYKGKAEYDSRYIEDGSYVKVDNITLGYNFNLRNQGSFKKIRLYLVGQHLITMTKYKGVDPEITLSGLAPGVDNYSYYPRTRRYTLGLDFSF